MKTNEEIRRDNLNLLIQENKGVSNLCNILNKSQAQIRQLAAGMVHSTTGKQRTIGNELAREIEVLCNKEVGWMDHENKEDEPNEITLHSASQDESFIKTTRALIDKLFQGISFKCLRIFEMNNDSMKNPSMSSSINKGDIAFIDFGVNEYLNDEIYLINLDENLMIRRLIKENNGLSVVPQNLAYMRLHIPENEIKHRIKIQGKVLKWWQLRSY